MYETSLGDSKVFVWWSVEQWLVPARRTALHRVSENSRAFALRGFSGRSPLWTATTTDRSRDNPCDVSFFGTGTDMRSVNDSFCHR